MRVLHLVENYDPSIGGMQTTVKQLSERLASVCDIHVATSFHLDRKDIMKNGVKLHQFNIGGNEVEGYVGSDKEISRFIDFLKNGNFDIITVFAAQTWTSDIFMSYMSEIPGKKVFFPTGFSALYEKKYKDYFLKMRNLLNKFDLLIFLSNEYQDIRFALKSGITNYKVIRNAVDEREFSDMVLHKSSTPLFFHLGSYTGFKGHEEAIEIFSRINVANATLVFVGDEYLLPSWTLKKMIKRVLGRPTTLKQYFRATSQKLNSSSEFKKLNKKIEFVQNDRKLVLEIFSRANYFLFPSRIECSPLVIFEAVASGTYVFSSDVGNSSEIFEWLPGSGEILPTFKDEIGFSNVDILKSASLINDFLSRNKSLDLRDSRNKCLQYYTWKNFTESFLEEYRLLGRAL
jgi:glycosyltransferase involved in cell wall biosynthesis